MLLSQYGHTAWRIQDGYFNGIVSAIAQTADGYIWIGTATGLLRFDGVRFVLWKAPAGEQLPSSVINSLLAARDGSLWIGTPGGLSQWVNGNLVVVSKLTWIAKMVEDRDSTIWFLRDARYDAGGPLCHVTAAGVQCYGKAEGIPLNVYFHLTEDSQGNFWLGGDTALVRWKAGSSTVYRPRGLKEGQAGVSALATSSDGSMWVGMALPGRGLGLQQLVGGAWKSLVRPGLDGGKLEVTSLFLDRRGALWIGTFQDGIYRVYHQTVDHFRAEDGLSGSWILAFFEDYEGNVWVATPNGLDVFHDRRVATFSTHEGLATPQVVSVLAGRDGTVWVGGSDSLDALRQNAVISTLRGKAFPGSQVTSLFEDHTGQFWVGVDTKFAIYKNGKFKWITKQNGRPIGMVVGITEDVENNIWVETLLNSVRSLLRIRDLKVQEEFPAPQMPAARRVVADPKGGIWLGLLDGDLARFRNGKAETFHFEGSGKTDVEQMMITPDGAVLGSTSFGLIGWKDGKQRILNMHSGLPCDSVHGSLTDNTGNLWLYAKCGVVEIAEKEVQKWWESPDAIVQLRLVFDVFDGAQPGRASFAAAARSADGRLWFANGTKLQMIDPAHLGGNSVPPPVHVEEIVADRKKYTPQEGLRIPPLARDLEIDYTALSLAIPQKVRFRYKLEGRDTEWQEPGTRRQAFYTDLRPRKYKFRVIACNSDGVWNEAGATLNFSVLPAWYQTNWFIFICVLSSIFLVYALYRVRLHQMSRVMSARFDERLAERTRIARELHDTLLQTIQGIKLVVDDALEKSGDPAQMHSALEQLSLWIGRATEEGRTALNSLRVSTTAKNDLAEAFKRAIEDCRAQPCSLEASFSVLGDAREMHPVVRDEVYRIGYEAIRNACTHSAGRRLEVTLSYGQDLTVRVVDNGRGINPAYLEKGKDGHFGLQGMRERAARIEGKLKIESSSNSGTGITLVVPGGIIFRRATSFPLSKVRHFCTRNR